MSYSDGVHLLFMRTKYALIAASLGMIPHISKYRQTQKCMEGHNWILIPLTWSEAYDIGEAVHEGPALDFIEFLEIAALGHQSSSARISFEIDSSNNSPLPYLESYGPRSHRISSRVNGAVPCQKPNFGKRLVVIHFKTDDDGELRDKDKRAVEGKLGKSARAIWHGRATITWGFMNGEAIALESWLDQQFFDRRLVDFLICDVSDITLQQFNNVSMLASWLEAEHVNQLNMTRSAKMHSAKTRTVPVEIKKRRKFEPSK
ncbi:MAG: hypothetical protein M3O03_09185 [Pseudomonadota bacterium]|nr:hypothetical protein [Pseudomonadota bacterium]